MLNSTELDVDMDVLQNSEYSSRSLRDLRVYKWRTQAPGWTETPWVSAYVMFRLRQAWRLHNKWEGGNDADMFLFELTISAEILINI